jgi:ABC-type Fe3+ transport system permease subunit
MTLATVGSIMIVLGVAVIAAAVALPVVYAFRRQPATRPSPKRTLHRAPAPRAERVSA